MSEQQQQWPADKVERRAISSLVASARNARLHSEAQVDQIAASIREWGWTTPVLIDEAGTIIAGHGRVLAAAKVGIVEVPVMVARGWTEAQKRAYCVADNKLTDNSTWDEALLRIELSDLQSMGFTMPLIGFTENEIEGLSAPENDPFREYVGMPEYEQNSAEAFQTIAVHFKTAEDVEAFAKLLAQQVTAKTKYLWYPPVEDQSYVAQQFVAEPAAAE